MTNYAVGSVRSYQQAAAQLCSAITITVRQAEFRTQQHVCEQPRWINSDAQVESKCQTCFAQNYAT